MSPFCVYMSFRVQGVYLIVFVKVSRMSPHCLFELLIHILSLKVIFVCRVLCSAFIFKLSDFCRSFFLCCVRVCAFVDYVCFLVWATVSVCKLRGVLYVQNL